MKLSDLLGEMTSSPDLEIAGLSLDSRKIQAGDLFFAFQGAQLDGRHYIDDAIKKGAAAVLIDSNEQEIAWKNNIPLIPILHLQTKIGEIAARFYDYPAKKMRMIGITGTNGKTSCSHFIAEILQQLHYSCGVIGTLGNGLYGQIQASGLTTPDAITLQKTFAQFVKTGADMTAMEVSSHSLDQGRVNGIAFDVGIFTNLTRDHLDYHGTMEAYGAAKKKLFSQTRFAVINADDPFGLELIQKQNNVFAYSITNKNLSVPSIFTENIELNSSGIHADIITPFGKGKIQANLMGQFNLSNLLAVITALCLLDIPLAKILSSLTHLQSVTGRMQTWGGKDKPLIVVDYAHTPDALQKVLIALREHCQGKLYCIFGCGGDRDRGKRSIMANIAEQYADQVIVTDDNPRHEDPKQIVADICQGFANCSNIMIEHDRAKAILAAIRSARAGDCVLIAGKGAETYQQIGDNKIPFSDIEQVQEILLNASLAQ